MAEAVIRRMEARDAAAVAQLVEQLGYSRSAAEVGEWIAGCGPGQAGFVACVEGPVAGWIEVAIVRHVQSAAFGLIGGLVVSEGVRGGGIGRRLCERAEAWCWEQGVESVRVTSRSTRKDAHRFYLRDGYELNKTSLVFEKRHANL
jgi:GNAT superfamily N-acetyltransferase